MAILSSPFDKNVAASRAQLADDVHHFVAPIRLALALTAFVALVGDAWPGRTNGATILILSGYAAACAAAWPASQWQLGWARGKLMHRLDAVACMAMTVVGGAADNFPLVFLLFAIVVASLRYGRDEALRATLGGVLLYCAAVMATLADAGQARLLLRAALLLMFGRAMGELGEWHIQAARRQALLHDLNRVANPRFGIDRTLTAALERTRAFFMADSCIVLLEEHDTGRYLMRAVRGDGQPVVPAECIDRELGRAMLPEPRTQVLQYVRPRRRGRIPGDAAPGDVGGRGGAVPQDADRLGRLADLLEAGSFISAPLDFCRGKGRIYVTASGSHLGRADAQFLARIAARELLAIDRIDLLDRIATHAAALERKKIALDLHDRAIQSCIGLQLALAAISRQATPSNPLAAELDKLVTKAADAIGDLRDDARGACNAPAADEPICLVALRRQAAQTSVAYGVEVDLEIEGRIEFGDRLAAEVLQVVREGISNVCRHTAAKRASVSLRCSGELLSIEISNQHGGQPPPPFRPRSISERASALGGSASVRHDISNNTIVRVEIPL
jgi:signal transduction histidine kinase